MSTIQLCYLLVRQSLASKARSRRANRILAACTALVACSLIYWEMQSSTLQSGPFAWSARGLRFSVGEGPSPAIRFPQPGPFDERLGYSRLPQMLQRLASERFVIERQARMSYWMTQLTDFGLFPIYKEKAQAGLTILGCDGKPVSASLFPQRGYAEFGTVPPLVVQSLLFIENRELLDERYPHRNPAIEWDRLGYAMVQRMAHLVKPGRAPGGSTLATQIEKYRHSVGGRTESAPEKLRQMASASLRAYLDGEDTLPVRQQIVVDYLNTMPLAAPPGVGEVFGLGDGLWGWYGADFQRVNRLLQHTPRGQTELEAKALAYRQVLSLLIAQRRPSGLLASDPSRLSILTDSHLRLLNRSGVIDSALLHAALAAKVSPAVRGGENAAEPNGEQKAADAVRTRLSGLLRMERVYDVDRLDLVVETPLQRTLQGEIARELKSLSQPEHARKAGLFGEQLLGTGDLSRVTYSFILLERTPGGNVVRVQADSMDRPFDVNDQAKLDLGSTAKLRTLVTYLEIVAELHERFGRLDREALRWVQVSPHDALSRWALDYLARTSDRSLSAMLDAAMDRRYSASPGESFFTGGGVHYFDNFHHADNNRIVNLRVAFAESINLPFIRLMRDIVQHLMFGSNAAGWVEGAALAQRGEYLARFADREGGAYLRRFYHKYHRLDPDEMLDALGKTVKPVPARLAVAFLSVAPDANAEALGDYLKRYLPRGTAFDAEALYARYAPERYTMMDRGALAHAHPLELWLVEFLRRQPQATLSEVVEASRSVRQEAYNWLFHTRYSQAQDIRIRSIREEDAFRAIHQSWRKLGYPFDSLVASYATAIGSSADRPAALADLMGIIVNDGVRMPTLKIAALHFASGTPFETRMVPTASRPERVLAPQIAATIKAALLSVVQRGTARRLGPTLTLADGAMLPIGGKTGTGDNRFEVFAAGGRVVSSRTVSRAGTFVFMLGERYFGTVTAYVLGEEAQKYQFTSALPVQVLKALTPTLARNLGSACVYAPGETFMTRKVPAPVVPQKVAALQALETAR
jgi:membrane peptidoglycan carboxypeptidase